MKKYTDYRTPTIPWLDSVPSHWDERRAKYLYSKTNRPALETDDVITCFRDGQVTLRKNRRTTGFTESLKEIGYQHIEKGDLVIHVMDAFAGAVGVADADGKGTPVYSVCIPLEDINNYYYAYIIREMARNGFIQSLYRGIRERSSDFRFEVFAAQILPVPPRKEQDQIVLYLDWQSSQINKLINTKREQIALLEEKRRSFTFFAVTQGLNKSAKKAPSDIYWLDSVPAQWGSYSVAQLFKPVKTKNTGMQEKNLLSLSYGRIKRRDINATEGLLPESFEGYNIIEANDIVLRLTDLQNDQKSLRTGLSRERGIVTSAYLTIRNISDNSPEYLQLVLHAFDLTKGFYNYGASGVRQGLNWDALKSLKLPVPPPTEQIDIVCAVNEEYSLIDSVIAAIQKEIDALAEYKTRLISDVVTGQIDIREVEIPKYEMVEELIIEDGNTNDEIGASEVE